MKSIHVDDKTAQRLQIFIASENCGHIKGKIGITTAMAINQYIDQKEKYIEDLAKKILNKKK